MKKRYLIIVLFVCLALFGCTKKEKELVKNKSFDKYTGIYKLDNKEFKVVHFEDKINYYIYEDGEIFSSNIVYIEEDKIENDYFKFKFNDNSVEIESLNDGFPSGSYKLIDGYSDDDIYKDFLGDGSLFSKEFTGKYTKDDATMYLIQPEKDKIRLLVKAEMVGLDLLLDKESENVYSVDMYNGEKYSIEISKDKILLKTDSKDEGYPELNGNYSKKSNITKADAVKEYIFNQ